MSKRKRIKKLEQRVEVLELILKIDKAKEARDLSYPVWYPVENSG